MAKKKAGGGKKDGMSFIVASKSKEYLKSQDCNVASDAFDGLNGVVAWYLEQASKRAKANGRKTVRPHDFCIM